MFKQILQLRTGYSMLNDYRHKLGQCESGLCECGAALPTSVSTLRRREDYTIEQTSRTSGYSHTKCLHPTWLWRT